MWAIMLCFPDITSQTHPYSWPSRRRDLWFMIYLFNILWFNCFIFIWQAFFLIAASFLLLVTLASVPCSFALPSHMHINGCQVGTLFSLFPCSLLAVSFFALAVSPFWLLLPSSWQFFCFLLNSFFSFLLSFALAQPSVLLFLF